jgi:hypothetical protein
MNDTYKIKLNDCVYKCEKQSLLQMGMIKHLIEDINTNEYEIPLNLNKDIFDNIISFSKNHLNDDFTETEFEDIEYIFSENDKKFINKFNKEQIVQLMNACDFLNYKLLLKLCIERFVELMDSNDKKVLDDYIIEKYKD